MDITLVFFVYGLAFFCMGLAMLLESGRSPLLAEARVLRPLAIFGLVHGAHEWLEMFLDKSEWLVFRYPTQIDWLRVGILTLSFTALMVFSLNILQPQRRLSRRQVIPWGIGLVLYTLLVFLLGLIMWQNHADWLSHVDAMARYLLAVPAAALAGIALQRQATQAYQEGRPKVGGSMRWAGWGFIVYAFTQALVRPLDVFPAKYLNTANFISLTGVPIQLVRGAMAVVITVGLIRAIQAVEEERQRQFVVAQKARLEALEQVQRELEERETMRQELLRHTVIAQEDERARIARELHDETAQTLTAFSLHLAALRDVTHDNPKAGKEIDRLQMLSRQMSQGIYLLVHDLRPAQLDDLGLVAALQYLSEDLRKRTGMQVDLDVSGSRQRLDSLVETVFFRVAQEALTNVIRHAGVQEATMQIQFSPQQVVLRVCDQGTGFDLEENPTPPRGWGLAGMRERTESIGGQLKILSKPEQGTTVEITVPLEADI